MSRPIVTKSEFQELAERRLTEAKSLLDQGQWDGAYYLAGYAVELGLKACIIKHILRTDAFPDKKFSEQYYTHSADKLVALANLNVAFGTATRLDPVLMENWVIVLDWSEQKRYYRIDQSEAERPFKAIADNVHGVFPWIKTQW